MLSERLSRKSGNASGQRFYQLWNRLMAFSVYKPGEGMVHKPGSEVGYGEDHEIQETQSVVQITMDSL